MSERGKYIVIEGSDGTGKSTQVEMLAKKLAAAGTRSVLIHEPDGVPVAARLRDIIKDGTLERDAWTNVLMFTAARRANWLQQMQPALERGEWVLAARNWLSTVVYQGYGEGESIDRIEKFTLENVSETYAHPDLTLILALNDELTRQGRINKRGDLEVPDTFESRPLDFQERVKGGYVRYANEHDFTVLDATGSQDDVQKVIWQHVEPLVVRT